MTTKVLEIRDRGTCILALAIRMHGDDNPVRDWFIHYRSGYPRDGSSIMLMCLSDGRATNDPYEWADHRLAMGIRTMGNAHDWIIRNWDKLQDGDVVDVEFLLNESTSPKTSERLTVSA